MDWRRCAARAMMIEYRWRSSMVEPWFCKPVVVGSSPIASSIACKTEPCARFFLFLRGSVRGSVRFFVCARLPAQLCVQVRSHRPVSHSSTRLHPASNARVFVRAVCFVVKNFTFNLYSARATYAGRCTISCVYGAASCLCTRDVLEI